MLDLSFIKDPEWRKRRAEQWLVLKSDLSDEFNRRELAVFERYFMDGEVSSHKGFVIGDGSLLTMHPRMDADAWDYILSKLVVQSDVGTWKSIVVSSLDDNGKRGWSEDEQIAFFDYIFGEEYKSDIAPRLGIGKAQKHPRVTLEPEYLLEVFLSSFTRWFRKEKETEPYLWINRFGFADTIVSALPENLIDLALRAMEEKDSRELAIWEKLTIRMLRYIAGKESLAGSGDSLERRKQALRLMADLFQKHEVVEGRLDQALQMC